MHAHDGHHVLCIQAHAAFELRDHLGLSRNVIVQATCHGKNNDAMIDALRAAGDLTRGVAMVEPDITEDELRELDEAGVRGAFEALLQDPEPEVRTAAVTVLTKVAVFLDESTLLDVILPSVLHQADDQSEHVRAALASVVNGLAPVLGRDHTIAHLLPLLLQLLRDTSSEVRLNIIAQLGAINAIIGVNLLAQSLLPTILDLARDAKWRVRMAIIERMPMLAQQLGSGLFNDRLCGQCITWLHDDVFSIRVAAATNLKHLADLFGVDWVQAYLLPSLTMMARRIEVDESSGQQVLANPSLHRMMALLALQALSAALPSDIVTGHVLPVVLGLSRDPVPNIRLNAARAIEAIAPLVDSRAVCGDIRPCLIDMATDPDRDVRYFAEKAMAVVSA